MGFEYRFSCSCHARREQSRALERRSFVARPGRSAAPWCVANQGYQLRHGSPEFDSHFQTIRVGLFLSAGEQDLRGVIDSTDLLKSLSDRLEIVLRTVSVMSLMGPTLSMSSLVILRGLCCAKREEFPESGLTVICSYECRKEFARAGSDPSRRRARPGLSHAPIRDAVSVPPRSPLMVHSVQDQNSCAEGALSIFPIARRFPCLRTR